MSQYATYPLNGVPTYANAASLPVLAINGSLAVTVDTYTLYIYESGTGWVVLSTSGGSSVVAVTATSPLFSSGGTSPNITIQKADATHDGYLSSVDWNTFNAKQPAGSYITALTGDVVASGPGSAASTIQPNVVSNSKLAQMANNTVKGNKSGLTANASDLALSDVVETGSSILTITNGAKSVVSAANLTIQVQQADSTHSGYLSSADWNTFNNKQSALTFGNLTGNGFTVTGGTGAVIGSGATIAMSPQNDIWVSRQGSDITGDGSIANPFQTVGKALTLVTSPSSTNNWTIHLDSGRHDQETNDLLLPPYTWIVGNGGPDVGSYLRLPAGKAVKLGSGWTSNSRGGIQCVYFGGGTSINLDFAAVGGSAGSNFMLDDVFVTGSLTHTGRGINGGDFLYLQNTLIFGSVSLTGSELQSLNSTYAGSITAATSSTVNSDLTFIGGSVSGNFSFTQTGTATGSVSTTGTSYLGTFTTTGTVALTADANLPIGYSLSGGTTRTNTTNAKSLAYSPATPGNWSPAPAEVSSALDQLAARSNATEYYVNLFTLTPTDISNKFVTLTNAPDTANKTQLTVVGGPMQDYGTDFTVSGTQLSWSGLFLDGVLVSGDKLIVQFN